VYRGIRGKAGSNRPTMTDSFITFIIQVASVALVVFLARWLLTARGSDVPRIKAGKSIYRVKWQMRALGYGTAAFCSLLAVKFNEDWTIPKRLIFPILFWVLAASGLWLASGAIIIDDQRITKRRFGISHSLNCDQISEVRVIKKRGLIKVCGGHRNLTIDSRLNATEHLLNEIRRRSGIDPLSL
jgi:hypothetical protein